MLGVWRVLRSQGFQTAQPRAFGIEQARDLPRSLLVFQKR